MNKDTMIWQTLSMIIAALAVNKNLPETKELFENKVVSEALCILEYPEQDVKNVLHTANCTEFAEILCRLYVPETPQS